MDEMNFLCKNCGHTFEWHEQSIHELWFCDHMDDLGNFCDCNNFVIKRATGKDGDEIEVQYDSETYKWN
jgi:hypothetical protein